MLEEHAYWALVFERWMVDENCDRGPRTFFNRAPAPIRPLVVAMVRRKVRGNLRGQGFGRHSPQEIAALGIRSCEAVADVLGDRPYLLGDKPCGADATTFAFIAGVLCQLFTSPVRQAVEKRRNLVAYRDRMMGRYYGDAASRAAA